MPQCNAMVLHHFTNGIIHLREQADRHADPFGDLDLFGSSRQPEIQGQKILKVHFERRNLSVTLQNFMIASCLRVDCGSAGT